jgi:predicted Zn-dependent protease
MTYEQQLRAAEGYSELGMYADALAQLDAIPGEQQTRLETIRMRIDIVLRQKQWTTGLQLGRLLMERYPSETSGFIHSAFCLHELGRTPEAKEVLLAGPPNLLEEPIYYYNLACYEAVLDNLEQARAYLRASFRLDKSLREVAKADPDLDPIRDVI